MRHNPLYYPNPKGSHWSVGSNEQYILLQTDNVFDQARIALTPLEAMYVVEDLLTHIKKVVYNTENKMHDTENS